MSVNVFSEEVLIKDTIFMSPTADGTALAFYVTRSSEPRQGLAITRAKEVPYLPVILGPWLLVRASVIKSTTSHLVVKGSDTH